MYFEIYHDGNLVHECRKTSYGEFNTWLWRIISECSEQERSNLKILVNKKEVSWEKAKEIVDEMVDERERKLEETHKKVWVKFQGVTNFKSNYKQIWVRK